MSWGLSDVKFLCVGHRGRFQLTYITRLVKIVAMNSSNCQGRHGKFTDNTLIPILIQVRDLWQRRPAHCLLGVVYTAREDQSTRTEWTMSGPKMRYIDYTQGTL